MLVIRVFVESLFQFRFCTNASGCDLPAEYSLRISSSGRNSSRRDDKTAGLTAESRHAVQTRRNPDQWRNNIIQFSEKLMKSCSIQNCRGHALPRFQNRFSLPPDFRRLSGGGTGAEPSA